MRTLTNEELRKLSSFTERSIEFSLFEPTQTGLSKSIIDATWPVREYLKKFKIHNYEEQEKGQIHKKMLPFNIVNHEKVVSSVVSLYRPETKNGDPRIWFRLLKENCNPNDIVCIFFLKEDLFLINLTQIDVEFLMTSNLSPLIDLIREFENDNNEVASELLNKLKLISTKGPVKGIIEADTSVGRTLETLLGIEINSSKMPDYKGIEIKTFRDKKRNRKNLFAQVPNWGLSQCKSSSEMLDRFGYKRNKDFKLYCTVSAITYNSQKLRLAVDEESDKLIEFSESNPRDEILVWELKKLHDRLLEKHSETFWITAKSTKDENGDEYFTFVKVEHTKSPLVSQFNILLNQGIITLDHLIKKDEKGNVKEKGPLFKIKPNALNLLFPPSNIYNLT